VARTHAKDANFSFNSVAIEDEVNTIQLTFDVNEGDATAFADAYQVPIAGKSSAVTEIQGTVDPAVSQGVDTLFDARIDGVKTTVYDLTGSGPNTDDPEYTSTASGLTGALFSSLRITYNVGDAARYVATLQHSGPLTRAVS